MSGMEPGLECAKVGKRTSLSLQHAVLRTGGVPKEKAGVEVSLPLIDLLAFPPLPKTGSSTSAL